MQHLPRRVYLSARTLLLALAVVSLWLAGCQSPERTTRMTADDFTTMSDAMARSFMASAAVRERTPQSPTWRIAIDAVENLTSDVMTASEQWSIMARLQSSLPLMELQEHRNILVLIPPERAVQLLNSGDPKDLEDFARDRKVTHNLLATFRSVTRATPEGRVDYYLCEFELLDGATAQTLWTDRVEVKRQARGRLWD
jgi:hypothetical protein